MSRSDGSEMPELGSRLGRYLLEARLGQGAAGTVYRAKDTLLGIEVALKVFPKVPPSETAAEGEKALARLRRELLLSRRVQHPGVCRVHDLHEDRGHRFFAMDLVEGETLKALLEREGRLPFGRAAAIAKGVAGAIAAAHAAGVVHRDLKPGNILLARGERPVVLDFGIATAPDVTALTAAGMIVGTLRYIAPEVWLGENATQKSDVYALGVLLYRMTTGHVPFDGNILDAVVRNTPVPPRMHAPELPEALEALILATIAVRPEERTKSAAALAEALAPFATPPPVIAEPPAIVPAQPSALPAAIAEPSAPALLDAGALEETLDRTDAGARDEEARADETERRPLPAPVAPVERPRVPARLGATLAAITALGLTALALAPGADDAPPSTTAPAPLPEAPAPVAPIAPEPIATEPAAPEPATPALAPPEPKPPATPSEPKPPAATPAPKPAPPSREPRTKPRPARKATSPATLKQARRALLAAMRARGLLEGDLSTLDAARARAARRQRAGRHGEALAALEDARRLVDTAVIDEAFIHRKLLRLNRMLEARPERREELEALQGAVLESIARRDHDAANRALNRCFLSLGP